MNAEDFHRLYHWNTGHAHALAGAWRHAADSFGRIAATFPPARPWQTFAEARLAGACADVPDLSGCPSFIRAKWLDGLMSGVWRPATPEALTAIVPELAGMGDAPVRITQAIAEAGRMVPRWLELAPAGNAGLLYANIQSARLAVGAEDQVDFPALAEAGKDAFLTALGALARQVPWRGGFNGSLARQGDGMVFVCRLHLIMDVRAVGREAVASALNAAFPGAALVAEMYAHRDVAANVERLCRYHRCIAICPEDALATVLEPEWFRLLMRATGGGVVEFHAPA